ncbi:MAG: hypothetical protein P4M08_14770 [Oligoflexia bacterium]|nr:hypothetical protein [Oligoflexia bacterium]
MKRVFRILSPILLVAAALSACQRPSAKRDPDVYRPDSDSYYNSHGAKNTTDQLAAMGQPKKRVVVLDFWNSTPVGLDNFGFFAAEELRRGLYLTQRMILSPEIKSEYTTPDFLNGDQIRVEQLVREGRKIGVGVIIIGRIKRIVFRQKGDDIGILRKKESIAGVDVELKIFDVSGGRELASSARMGEASSNSLVSLDADNMEAATYRAELVKAAIRNAIAQLVPDVVKGVDKLAWQGRIAKTSGTKIYVNAGKTSGLVVGDILRVMAPGDDIYDPTTGAFLGRTPGQLKGTLEVVDFLGVDGAVTVVHTGGNFQENDLVQLY